MELGKIMGRMQKVLLDNSPVILTAIGVAGALTTAYLTGRASFALGKKIAYEESENQEYMTFAQKKKFFVESRSWVAYIPAAGSAAVTVAAILGANKIGTRRTAALASAYAISERAFDAYRDKVFEKLGEGKERAIRDEIAQDDVTRNPPTHIILTGGNVLCRDGFSGRDFRSTMEDIRRAQNTINHQVNNDFVATLGDFYQQLGLEATDQSEEFGWLPEKLLDVKFSSTLTAGGEPCMVFSYKVTPIRGHH